MEVTIRRLDCGFGGGYGAFRVRAENIVFDATTKVAIVVGDNGSGKSTFLKALASTDDVIIVKREIQPSPIRFQYVPQTADESLFPDLTLRSAFFVLCRRALQAPIGLRRLPPIEELTARLPTTWQESFNEWKDRRVGELSRGQQVLLSIATAAVAEPKGVLLLDEPTAGLDKDNRQLVMDFLEAVGRNRPYPIICSTHEVEFIEKFSGPHFIVNEGEVKAGANGVITLFTVPIISALVVGVVTAIAYETFQWVRRWKNNQATDLHTVVFECAQATVYSFIFVEALMTIIKLDRIDRTIGSKANSDELTAAREMLEQEGPHSLFTTISYPRIQKYSKDLELMGKGEVKLQSADEVTSAWLTLIGNTQRQLRATNVVSPDFWQHHRNMGETAFEAHREAIQKNGVQIRRLHVLDTSSKEDVRAVTKLAAKYDAIKVQNRFLDIQKLEAMPDYSDCIQQLTTPDFVVFDDNVALLVTLGSHSDVHSGLLSKQREEHVSPAIKAFDHWWSQAAETLIATP